MGKNSAKRGQFQAVLEAVAGRVSWSKEWTALKAKAEAAGVAVVDPVAADSVRLSVVSTEAAAVAEGDV